MNNTMLASQPPTYLMSVTKENVPPCEWYFKCVLGHPQTLYFLRLPNTEFGSRTNCPDCGKEMRQKFNCFYVLQPGIDIQVSTHPMNFSQPPEVPGWMNHKLKKMLVFMHVDRILLGTSTLWFVTEEITHLLPNKITSIACHEDVARTFDDHVHMANEFGGLINESIWALERIKKAMGNIK